jgi:hypothetical protein
MPHPHARDDKPSDARRDQQQRYVREGAEAMAKKVRKPELY